MESGKKAVFITGVALAAALSLSRCPDKCSDGDDEEILETEEMSGEEGMSEDSEVGSVQAEFHDVITQHLTRFAALYFV